MPLLADVVTLLDSWYPPHTADSWDVVGLVAGDPTAEVERIMFAVDPTFPVAEEAAVWGADLLVVHHPLFLKAVHDFPASSPKVRTLSTLIRADCALLTAHTNADQAAGGVSEAMAQALGLTEVTPLLPSIGNTPRDKVTVFVPLTHAQAVRDALAAAGAGRIGDYESASFSGRGEGRFRPLRGATPHLGEIGRLEVVEEERIEAIVPRHRRSAVVRAMLAAHPYEEPAWDLVELVDLPSTSEGTGRIGTLPEGMTLQEFAAAVAVALPETAGGLRVGGDLDREVRRVALCGGAGDFLLDRVAGSDVDVYVTSDLRHHPAAEFLEKDGPALIDVPHWAAEWTWLPVVERKLRAALGDTVETRVSTTVTDPWSLRL
ncbi:Nif3-like dinuclear metal center hexameric protein [Nocardioides insulae]|uniref:Nif3-like dinuclear metal center hexameric protein n=1 Tax=Nocardioides insulae TaxID=394734 RepID=UPI0003FF55EE|nr:Nif3-like dinuclear metal center hexameric protein [Nocardioides insulae]